MYHEFKKICMLALAISSIHTSGENVKQLRITEPVTAQEPIYTDSTDATGKAFDYDKTLMNIPFNLNAWKNGIEITDSIIPATDKGGIRLLGFEVETPRFAKIEVKVKGLVSPYIYIDGIKKDKGDLTPGRHAIAIKYIQKANKADTLNVDIESKQMQHISINPIGDRLYTLDDYLHGTRAGSTSLSADGRFLRYSTTTTLVGGKKETSTIIHDLETGNEYRAEGFREWATEGNMYIRQKSGADKCTIYEYVNLQTGSSTPFFTDYTQSNGSFTPGEKLMVIHQRTEGPKEDKNVFQILEPDDRIAGWRTRTNIQLLDVESGTLQQITMGQHNAYATLSDDTKQMILTVREECITERPFSFSKIIRINRETHKTDTLVQRDGFINNLQWSPDGKSLVFSGSPEAFGGIGKNDPTDKIPSMTQTELFLMDLETKKVESLTFDFNPNVDSWEWSRADGNIYALCENRDRKDIFRLNMKNRKWEQLKLSESSISSFSLSRNKPLLSYTGQSESNSDRIYTVDLKKDKEKLIFDNNAERMKSIALGPCKDWNFQTSRGDSICGRYYLPPHFDENKKYPMLVYYYGGCSPVGRNLDSYYNFHGWAAMGYVVYVIQPSGCTGFGQEFAARHVNAWGEWTAQDIIEGTKQFCKEHPYVNSKKIGCLGASYGGFMTMYLQTVTDIFAAAMAHAGISNVASYWGYGYWGYSYNAIAAANSYPWNNPEVMSGRSPLFNADKVNTPILFLHGNADTNVPIVESTQMFNALKILGKECAFVTVDGENHHILEYDKRRKWVHTFYAWFAKYLQDDPTWWETLYPTKNL